MKSNWLEFIEDTGDCVGGVLIGYAIAKDQVLTGVIGTILVLLSVFLKHYKPK
jgi:hypothetical protein